ncbi:unnamed protein product, partial [marine sediment metagenome]
AFAKDPLIIRTSTVYGLDEQHKSFPLRVVQLLKDNQTVYAPENTVTPTYVEDVVSIAIQRIKDTGIIHASGPESCTKLDFARRIAEVFSDELPQGYRENIERADFLAKRPKKGGLVFTHNTTYHCITRGLKALKDELAGVI